MKVPRVRRQSAQPAAHVDQPACHQVAHAVATLPGAEHHQQARADQRLALGQRFYFSDQRVTLPGGVQSADDTMT